MIRRESPTSPGNYFQLSLAGTGSVRALTQFPHPYPQLANVYKEVIRYERNDGVMLTATLYLPPGKTPADGPFPFLASGYAILDGPTMLIIGEE